MHGDPWKRHVIDDSSSGADGTRLADVATFVRFAWNNGKGRIKPEAIAEVRKELGDRQTVLSPEEVRELYPK